MIDLEYLTLAINEIIGRDKYLVYLKTNAAPEDLGDRNTVTMEVARYPYAFTTEEFDAENMTITLTFDLPTAAYGEDLRIRDQALWDIQTKLFGWRTFNVEQAVSADQTEMYVVTANFELQPSTNPYVDSGRKTQQIVLSGNALIRNEKCLATVGNNVKVSIDGTPLLKLTHAAGLQIGADNNIPLSENKTLPEMHGISQTATKNITFLYTGKAIENEFLSIAEGCVTDINKEYTYKVEYPNGFSLAQKIKITSASAQTNAGVFLQYTINAQVTEEKIEEVTE